MTHRTAQTIARHASECSAETLRAALVALGDTDLDLTVRLVHALDGRCES